LKELTNAEIIAMIDEEINQWGIALLSIEKSGHKYSPTYYSIKDSISAVGNLKQKILAGK